MEREELKASGLILDLGVSIPFRPLRFLNLKKKSGSIVIRHPYPGGLIRMSEKRLQIGISHEEMRDYTTDQNIEFMAKHGRNVCRIVTMAILRGYFSYKLFHRFVTWWLLWRVHPLFLSEAMFQLFENVNVKSFTIIIKLAESISPTKPRLSHKEKGS